MRSLTSTNENRDDLQLSIRSLYGEIARSAKTNEQVTADAQDKYKTPFYGKIIAPAEKCEVRSRNTCDPPEVKKLVNEAFSA